MMHKNLQAIMMSTKATFNTMRRCLELGASFLVNKPIDLKTIHNMWQHLNLKDQGMNKIKYLMRGWCIS
ncbi:hypothetical protein ACP70R_009470 [Stipagrostis hirtigluma subsp. patula]